jgi:hypothetical protein
MKLGICLITIIKYPFIFVIFLGTMTVFSYLSPGGDSVGNEPDYAYQQASKEQVLSAQLPPKSMVVKITSPENQNLPVGELRNNESSSLLSTGGATKRGPYNILFPTVMNNESSSLLSNNTQQGSPVEEHKQNITSPQGVNKTTDTPYPDVLLEREPTEGVIEEEEPEMWPQQQGLQDEQQQLSIAEDQITSAVNVKEGTTPTDTPYPDVLLEEVIEEEEPEMWPQQQGLQDEQQQLSIAENQITSAVKEVWEEQPEMKLPLLW